ncbi:MAG: IPTL-CTERM sorting domain-containing protein [Bacteroidota bacterium]
MMKKLICLLVLSFTYTGIFAQLSGTTWKLAPQAAALGVGPAKGDISWWSNTTGDVTTRACLFDDTFVFNADGSFKNVQDGSTWLEGWQGVNPDACGTPIAPHDGSSAATWAYDGTAGTLTLTGVGAHLGLAKVVNGSELSSPSAAPNSITYEVVISGNSMTIDINFGGGYWRFIMEKVATTFNLPVDFETPVTLADFGGNASEQIVDPTDASNIVVKSTKTAGAQIWAGTTINGNDGLTAPIPFTTADTKMTVRVYSPTANTPILLKVEDKSNGGISVETQVLTTVANAWETLEFDFMNHAHNTPPLDLTKTYDKVSIFFNFGTMGMDDVYYWDDVQFGAAPIPADPNTIVFPVDFECEFINYTFTEFGGSPTILADNPNKTGINTSDKVAQLTKTTGAAWWSGAYFDMENPIDFSIGTELKVKVYSPKAGINVRLKLEQVGDPSTFQELDATVNATNTWEELTYDFTGATNAMMLQRVVIFFEFDDVNQPAGDGSVYYFDDISQTGNTGTTNCQMPAPPMTSPNTIVFPVDFQCEFIDYAFTEFGGAPTELADNPNSAGINTSDKVAQLTKTAGAQWWAGSFFDMENPIDFDLGTEIKVKVYSPKAGINVRLKLEQVGNGAVFQELDATVNAANTWEELTYNFTGATNTMMLQRVVIFFEFDDVNQPVGDGSIYYFDDISQTGNPGMTDCQAPADPTEGATVPPACEQVVSIYSDTYPNLGGTNFDPNWDGGSGTEPSEEMIDGNNYYKYSNFNFQGIQLASPVDVTAMTHLHVDIWTAADATANIFPISISTGEQPFAMNIIGQQWNSFDIPLSHFTNLGLGFTDIHQFKFDGGTGNEIFMDNLYFYGDCNVIPACPNLVWSDEFDGTTLNTANWEQQIGDGTAEGIPGWGNNELQYYQAANTTVAGGILTITAKEESVGGYAYTSSRIRTKNLQDFAYGRFEASIKLPIGQGIWPAFWMLSTDEAYGGWPKSGEIDIMEYLGHEPEKAFGTIHYGDFAPNNKFTSSDYFLPDGTFNDDFHEFAIEWDENVIRWYVDDILYGTKTPADIAPDFWPFNQNFHFLLNIAVGGNLPGSPDASTMFPQTMEVNYVRVYKGQFPYINGNQLVANEASGEMYTIGNAPTGSTYNWTVPTGATITSGQGTASITVDWGDMAGVSDISVVVSNNCDPQTLTMPVKVDIARVSVLECVLENFDSEPLITPLASGEAGTLEEDVTNPAPNGVNSSALVAKYTRSANQFDNFQYTTTAIPDAGKFVNGDKKFFIDIYTDAPVGTPILLQLENQAKAMGTFPAGRHSNYEGLTTAQNAWQRIELAYKGRLDGATTDTEVDKLVFLFNSNTNTTNVYYFDNFDKFCTSSTNECANTAPCVPESTCGITNLTVGECVNGATEETQIITVRDVENPNCAASTEAPICSDGTIPEVRFTPVGSSASSSSFQLLADGVLISTGGSSGVFPSTAPMVSVTDPCNCDDPLNVRDGRGNNLLYHDVLTFTGTGPIVCTSNCGAFLDRSGNPITNFGTAPAAVDFYRSPGDYAASTFDVGGINANLAAGTCGDTCPFINIPTMSQWGLLIFGLLMLNLGVMLLYRKELNEVS